MRRTRTALFVVLVFALVLAGACHTPAGRSTGQVIDDSTITSEVKGKLLQDEGLKSLGISVNTFEGQVTLTGAVNTPDQKSKATQIAQNVKGVQKVNNLISVKQR